jgi:membrane-associated protein
VATHRFGRPRRVWAVDLISPALTAPLLLGIEWMDPQWWLDQFGAEMFWASVIVVFVECGLLFPILPGDSLLFSIGVFVHRGDLDIDIVTACVVLSVAAFAGNVVGYEIGRRVGDPLFEREGRFLNQKNFRKTHDFFEKYGARALVLGRFVPIVRTFITVVAGAGEMDRRHFWTWSFVGAVLWATGLTLIGYAVGGNEVIQENLEAAILVIVAISVLPMVYEYLKHRREVHRAAEEIADDLT